MEASTVRDPDAMQKLNDRLHEVERELQAIISQLPVWETDAEMAWRASNIASLARRINKETKPTN